MKEQKKSIAFYCGSLARGGTERVIVNLAEYFNRIGYRVYIITQYQYEMEYPIEPGIIRIVSDLTEEETGKNRIKNFLNRWRKLRGILKKIKADVVVSHFGKNNFMTITACMLLKTKVVVTVVAEPHLEYYTGVMRLLAKTMFAFADGIVLRGREARSFFPKYIGKRAVVLPNPLNDRFLIPRYEGEREKEIVAVGRMDENKNQALLIRAFAEITEEFPDYRLVIHGDGSERPKLEKLVESLKLGEKVIMPGRTDTVEEKVYKSGLFIMTSNTEGMPNALIEAMALGLPSISTDCPCGGPRELIQHGINGFLFPVGDQDALCKQIRYCLSHLSEMEEVGRRASEIQKELNPKTVYQGWEQYLNEVIRGNKHRNKTERR